MQAAPESIELVAGPRPGASSCTAVTITNASGELTSTPLPVPSSVRFRSASLAAQFRSESDDEHSWSAGTDEIKKPLFTPGMVMSCLWLVVAETGLILNELHIFTSDAFEIIVGLLLSVSLAIFGYLAFCVYRLASGMPFKYKSLARLGRILYPVLGLLFSPLLLGAIAMIPMFCVLQCNNILQGRDPAVLMCVALMLFFLPCATTSTITVYGLARRIQEAYCAASMTLSVRRVTAAIVALCHVFPAVLLLVLFSGELQHVAVSHDFLPARERIQIQAILVSFALGQLIPFGLLKVWLYPKRFD
jgi:hypothetical protein